MKKFVLSSESRVVGGVTLYRVQACRDFMTSGEVPVFLGSRGGWVESESCLDQEGACWVANEAVVYSGSEVRADACVFGDAVVLGGSVVTGDARVAGHAVVSDRSFVGGAASVGGDVVLSRSRVAGRCWLVGSCRLSDTELDGEVSIVGSGSVDSGGLDLG
jgi:hypothetical protein